QSHAWRDALVVGEVPLWLAVALLQQRIHCPPDGQHSGMLSSVLVSALHPGEDLDIREPAIATAVDDGRLVGDETELVQGGPVTAKQVGELGLGVSPDPERADHSLINHEAKH